MKRPLLAFALLLFVATAPAQVTTQARELTLDDALNPGRLMPRGLFGLAWKGDGEHYTWLARTRNGLAWLEATPESPEPKTLLSGKAFKSMAEKAGAKGLAFTALAGAEWTGPSSAVIEGAGGLFELDLERSTLRRLLDLPDDAEAQSVSPDHKQAAYSKDKNVFVRKPDGTVFQVTQDGFEFLTYGLSVSRVEFGIKDGLWWDPTSRRLGFYSEDLRPILPYPFIDWKPRPAKHVLGRYPMAGQAGSSVRVGVYDSHTDEIVWLATDPTVDEYLTNVTWGPKGESIYVAHVNRAQNAMQLVRYDATTGKKVATLFEETDEQWVEPEHGPIFLPDDSGRFLWFSPRDGFNHLYLYTGDGHLLQQVTKGKFDVASFLEWRKGHPGEFFFTATGKDPRDMHLFLGRIVPPKAQVEFTNPTDAKIAFEDGQTFRQVTTEPGQHSPVISPNGDAVLDTWSRLGALPQTDVIAVDTGKATTVNRSRSPLTDYALGEESFFQTKTDDGQDLYGYMIAPPERQEGKKYPVLLWVYSGPHSQFVKNEFMGGLGASNLWLHYMATHGFVVLRVDGRGTLNRGINWVQCIHRHLGDLEVKDQVAALDKVISMGFADPDRVGVHGWSYGGFMTLSLVTKAPKRFKAAVAGAPVTDWRYYETGYGERYMDRPQENEKGYDQADPGRHIKDLQARLLVVHGSGDKTVVWQNTLDFLEKSIQAGKDVEYFVYPGRLHGLRGKDRQHFMRKMTAFFQRNL